MKQLFNSSLLRWKALFCQGPASNQKQKSQFHTLSQTNNILTKARGQSEKQIHAFSQNKTAKARQKEQNSHVLAN